MTDKIEVEFQDTGEGMTIEQIKQIFNPFYTTKEVGKGTGLGLSVSLGIMESIGGSIEVQSIKGSGSIFTVVFPINNSKELNNGMTQLMNSNNVKVKVLIVDDEDRFRESLSRQLDLRGFTVLDTDNGEDAIKIVRHENPEVVILDKKMPQMDGIQTLKEVKKIRPEVQIIMHTGHGEFESARVTGKHGVACYLEKPCSLDEMIEAIQAAVEERKYELARHEILESKRDRFKANGCLAFKMPDQASSCWALFFFYSLH